MKTSTVFFQILLFSCAFCAAADYSNQAGWSGDCNTGTRQSPIDIPCKDFIQVCPARINYQVYWEQPRATFGGLQGTNIDLTTGFVDNSWVKFTNATNSYIFKSLQFHLHQPSEHTVNGKQYELELHIVHKLDSPSGIFELLVIGIFFEVDPSLTYDFLDYVDFNAATSFSDLFPFPITNSEAYHYLGSLTTPGCAQIVNWFVQLEPVKITQASMDRMKARVGGGTVNNRIVQALNNRQVYLVGRSC